MASDKKPSRVEEAVPPGELLAAKWAGTCALCQQKFPAGTRILWLHSTAVHETCARQYSAELQALGPGPIVLSGERGYSVGETLRDGSGRVVVVVLASSRFLRQDGLSFGLSRDRGTLHTAQCRPASEVEAGALAAQEDARKRDEAAKAFAWRARRTLDDLICFSGTTPPAAKPAGVVWPVQRTYDADYYVIDEPGGVVWLVVYNGRSGDDWGHNNMGSSRAICAPLTPDLRALLVTVGALTAS